MRTSTAIVATALLSLVAGCQTQRPVDPLSTIVVAGNYRVLSSCFAASQAGAVTSSSIAGTGIRTITVTTPAVARSAQDALADVQDAGLAAGYSTAFTEARGNNTQISGTSLGPSVVPFYWRDVVIRQLRTCTGNPTLS